MLELRVPQVGLRAAWLDSHAEWGPGSHEDGFGIEEHDDVRTAAGFTSWVERLRAQADPATAAAISRRVVTYRWIVEDGAVLGGIALRHELVDRTWPLGHVGYGVRPSARGRGVASWALRQMIDVARDAGLGSVDLVCERSNVASARTIERAGGVAVDTGRRPEEQRCRYTIWLDDDRA